MATYNVTAQTRRVQYTGDGTAGNFAFSFQINATSELKVYVDSTEKTETTHYTVTLNSGTGAGTVAFTSGNFPTSSQTVTLLSDIPLSRTSVYTSGGQLTASSLEDDFDTNMFIHQQTNEEIDRSLRLAEHDVISGADMTLPVKATRAGKILGFNETTGNPEASILTADAQTLADIASDIATLADIEDGTDATDAIQTVAADIQKVEKVSNNITSVQTTSNNITSVNTVATNITNTNTVATNIASVNTVATNIADVITVANDLNEAVSEVVTVADDLNEAVSEIDTVATSITNVETVATNISNVNTVAGISSNVTTVAGISSDITAVVGDATDIGTVATDLSGSDNIGTVAGSISNVNSVAGSITNVNTVATNLSGVNSFGERYRVSSSAPTTSLDVGDLYYDTTSDTMKVYGSSGWQNAGSSVNGTSQRYHYDITGTPTSVTGADKFGNTLTYDAGYADVYVNGIRMSDEDITITSGDTVTFASALTNGDNVDIVAYGTFSVASMNADNLDSGTVPSARVSGAYTGITSVGTLTSLDVTGAVTGNSFETLNGVDINMDANGSGQLKLDGNGYKTAIALNAQGMNIYTNSSGRDLILGTNETQRLRVEGNGDINFYEDTGATSQFFWDASEQTLGIGTSSADGKLHVHSSSAGTVTAATDANQLVLESAANVGMSFLTGNTSSTRIKFGDPDSNSVGAIQYVHSDDSMRFKVNGSERVRVDSDGLKFNGDTAANNALSDYEQGSWTVDVQDSSGNSATSIDGNGRYIKVGNLVTVTGRFSDPDLTGLVNNDLRIYGLPFAMSAFGGSSLFYNGPAPRMENVSWDGTNSTQISTQIGEGATYVRFVESRNNSTDDFLTVGEFSSTSDVWFSITYSTTTF